MYQQIYEGFQFANKCECGDITPGEFGKPGLNKFEICRKCGRTTGFNQVVVKPIYETCNLKEKHQIKWEECKIEKGK